MPPRRAPAPLERPTGTRLKRGEVALDEPVHDALFDAIMSRRLAPGARLGEAALCEVFDVSRTVVRKALQRLALTGLVDIVPNKGASVAAPSPQETHEVFEARRALEAAIVPLAMKRLTPSKLAQFRQRLAAEHEALHAQDHSRWVRLAGDFHLALAELAGNRHLTRMLGELMSRCSLIVALYEAPGDAACEHDEHAELIELLSLGNAPAAIALMDKHLTALETRLRIEVPTVDNDLAAALFPR